MATIRTILCALACASVTACNQATYVSLRIDQANTATPTTKIDLALELAGRSATATLAEPGGKPIAFPTTATLQIEHGTGSLTVIAFALDAAGALIDETTASVDVLANKTVQLPLRLGDAAPPGAPGPPTNVIASSGNAQATVSWTPPGDIGSSPITSYRVISFPDGIEVTTTAATPMVTVSGLTNGTTYTFAVAAMNAAGTGSAGISNPVTPSVTPLVPAAPTNVMAVANIEDGATVSWTAPDTSGSSPITKYTVTSSPGGAMTTTPDGKTTSVQVTGLTAGTTYQFTVFASNSVGAGPASISLSSVVVLGKLPAPSNVVACGADGAINVSFATVAGAQSYDVFYNASGSATAGSHVNIAGSPATITVPNGSYHVAIAAVNGIGDGTPSTDVTTIADTQIHDTLFVAGQNGWDAFDCFSQLPDGTSAPTRSVPHALTSGAYGITVDPINAVVWVIGGAGVIGYADAKRVNGTTSATYTMTINSPDAIALDTTNHKFYVLTAASSLQRFAYTSPSDLNTATPTSEATFAAGNPLQLFVNQANGDVWEAFYSSVDMFGNHVPGGVAVYPAAYNLANGATASKSFQLGSGATDYALGVAYSSASGGTLYAGWSSSTTTATDDVTGIDSASSGLVSVTGTIAAASGTLAIGNSMLLVPSGTSVQAWSIPTPGNNPIKTVSMPSLSGAYLFYVP